MNVNSNIISRYDDMLYENRPASLNEFLSNKYNNVHNELYKSALNKFILSLVSKYVTKDFLYECFELLSEIDAYTEDEIIFENIYENIFSKEDNSPLINYMLNELSIDRISFFKILYDTTVNKLNSVKTKLINFYRDENYDIKSAIKGISEISDIQDFRLAYIISGIGSETNNDRNIFTLYTDDDGELVVSNKVIFDNEEESQEYISQDMYYYVGTELPNDNMNPQIDEKWHNICNDHYKDELQMWQYMQHIKNQTGGNGAYISDYYVAIPAGYGIYRNYKQDIEKEKWNNQEQKSETYTILAGTEIEQISLSIKSPYTYVKSIIINKIVYNVYITTMNIHEYENMYEDTIKINPESIINNNGDDFDLICSEDKEYIILYDFGNNVRIGYDENGKWLLIVNDEHPINTIDI